MDIDLHLDLFKMAGAILAGAEPFNQLSFQNKVSVPSPTEILVQASNRARSEPTQGVADPFQGLSLSFHLKF